MGLGLALIPCDTVNTMPKESSPAKAHAGSRTAALIIGAAFCVGLALAGVGYRATSSSVAKIVEELAAVNETIQGNAEQFSLVPYAEDPDVATTLLSPCLSCKP